MMKTKHWLAIWIPIQLVFLYLTTIPSLNIYHEIVISNLCFTILFFIIMYKKTSKQQNLREDKQ